MIVLSQTRKENAAWSSLYYQGWYNDKEMIQKMIALKHLPNGNANIFHKNLKIVADVMENVYPGMWDLVLMDENLLFGVGSSPYAQQYNGKSRLRHHRVIIIVRYPETKIRGDKISGSHTIYDFMLYFEIVLAGSYMTLSQSVYGTRLTASMAEVDSNYHFSHTHIHSYSSYGVGGCCLGNAETSMMLTLFNNNDQKNPNVTANLLKMFMINMKTYVSHESSDGGPYIYTTSIKRKSSSNGDNQRINLSVRIGPGTGMFMASSIIQILATQNQLNLSFLSNRLTISDYDSERFEDIVKHILYNNFGSDTIRSYLCVKNQDGLYKIPSSFFQTQETEDETYLRLSEIKYAFRGELISRRVYDYEPSKDNRLALTADALQLHPLFLLKLKPYVNSVINKEFVKYTYLKKCSPSRGQ